MGLWLMSLLGCVFSLDLNRTASDGHRGSQEPPHSEGAAPTPLPRVQRGLSRHVRGESVRDTSLVEAAEVADVSMDGTVLRVTSELGGSLQASRDGSQASGGRARGSLTADALQCTDVRLVVEPTSVCEVFGQERLLSPLARSRSANTLWTGGEGAVPASSRTRDVTDEKKLLYCQRSEGDRRSHGA